MRVVFFLHSLRGGGAERVASTLASHWARAGHDVTVLTTCSDKSDVYALEPSVGRASLDLEGESSSSARAVLANLRRLLRLRVALLRLAPDVVIGFMATAGTQLGLLGLGRRMIVLGSERSFPPSLPIGRAWEWLRRHAYRRLHAVVAVSGETAQWVRRNTGARRVVVIGNPVPWPLPTQPPLLDPDDTLLSGRRMLLAVGRLAEEKQPLHLVEAMAALVTKHPMWDLVFLGEGPMRDEIGRVANDLGIADRVFLPGRAGNVGAWYQRADLFAMTSRYEGFPNVLAEAMASGVAAVSYDCDTGPRDIIHDSIDGVLVAPNDKAGLVLALDRLMSDDATRLAMAERAKLTRERFSLASIALQWERLVDELREVSGAPR